MLQFPRRFLSYAQIHEAPTNRPPDLPLGRVGDLLERHLHVLTLHRLWRRNLVTALLPRRPSFCKSRAADYGKEEKGK